jgi:fumarate hydratase class II
MPRPFLRALGLIKGAAARVNRDLRLLDAARSSAIAAAAAEVESGKHDRHFPIDVFQTGSGTSTNMNANEVIAHRASAMLGRPVHPNDHVNLGQSSNDVIPAAIHVAACLEIHEALLPALDHLARVIERRARELRGVVKTGRTHLMDAMPVRMGQELGGWAAQVRTAGARIEGSLPRLQALALGGSAVGTGVNADPEFGPRMAARLSRATGIRFVAGANHFQDLSSQETAVEMSGQLRAAAVALMKIANDLRWMNSGPLAGLGEIRLPALQPGSSIMPGKVNPVIPEAVAMAGAQVLGYDVTIAVAAQSGSFQLNVMLPLIAFDLLSSIRLLATASRALADQAIAGFEVNRAQIEGALGRNPILVTALNSVIGYEKGAAIAKRAYAEGRPILDVAREMTGLGEKALARLLDPERLTHAGIPHAGGPRASLARPRSGGGGATGSRRRR